MFARKILFLPNLGGGQLPSAAPVSYAYERDGQIYGSQHCLIPPPLYRRQGGGITITRVDVNLTWRRRADERIRLAEWWVCSQRFHTSPSRSGFFVFPSAELFTHTVSFIPVYCRSANSAIDKFNWQTKAVSLFGRHANNHPNYTYSNWHRWQIHPNASRP